MKRLSKIFITSLLILTAFLVSAVSVSAEDADLQAEAGSGEQYIVAESSGVYSLSLYKSGVPETVLESTSLSELLDAVKSGSSVIFNTVNASENISITNKGVIEISGILNFSEDYSLTLDSECAALKDISLSFCTGGIRVRGGLAKLISGCIESEAAAVRLEQTDSAVFEMLGGRILCRGSTHAVKALRGTVRLYGGEVSSLGEYAVFNTATLYLSRTFSVFAAGFEIYTERAVSLMGDGECNPLLLKYGGAFGKGTITELLLCAKESDVLNIKIFDLRSKEYTAEFFVESQHSEEKNFIAVFDPLKIIFKDAGTTLFEIKSILDAQIDEPAAPEKTGYDFKGWFSDESFQNRFYFDSPINADTVLYAGFDLKAAEFLISSHTLTYDGRTHSFSLDHVYHPLENEGSYIYEWRKDGEYFSSGEYFTILSCIDSGEYSCVITFLHGQNKSEVSTPAVSISILKAELELPTIPSEYYSGSMLYPDIIPSTLYSVNSVGGLNAGIYPAVFTLADSVNYKWKNSDSDSISVNFEIIQAENSFTQEFEVFDIYSLAEGTFSAKSLFGCVVIRYYDGDGVTLLESIPDSVGEYFAEAVVEGCSDYKSLRSALMKFNILKEEPIGLSVLSGASVCEYKAFDLFNAAGLSVSVSYNSGRCEIIGAEQLGISYQSANSLRFGDSAVIISYSGAFVLLPVTVKKADYDISQILFSDSFAEYNGYYRSPIFEGTLPIGEDGIALTARVEGGGADAGIYDVCLIFESESVNYNIPDSICANFTILARTVSISWGECEFTYNGKKQCPTAHYTDVYGTLRELDVDGSAYTAGDSYTATARKIKNYAFENESVSFTIKKASYDLSLVLWTDGSFIYNGEEQGVSLVGLPSGVSIGGYSNNIKTSAGEYFAKVTLIYDNENYNEPSIEPFLWRISPADYDMSGFSFENVSVVFDGEIHYPLFSGEMPSGADGSVLNYRFSNGACHVNEGKVDVRIEFYTDSMNYNTPSSWTRTVTVEPAPIHVSWLSLSFVYDEAPHIPLAVAEEASISVSGEAIDAGEYTALAFSDDSDYYVVNSQMSFCIEKAENRFTVLPYAEDIFAGRAAVLGGASYFGDVSFKIYAERELLTEVSNILEDGVYYAVASVSESKNYLSLKSSPIEFTVIEVVPVNIDIVMHKSSFTAFDIISPYDFSANLIYNDGKTEALDTSSVRIIYASADSLRFSDTYVTFSSAGFFKEAKLSVSKAVYDLGALTWSELEHSFDGKEKRATISGLPDSMRLIRIDGGRGVYAGEYIAHAVFEYDTENYEEPTVPDAVLVIKRAVVDIPKLESMVYNGSYLEPDAVSELWYADFSCKARDAGEYIIKAVLTDEKNYIFENGKSEALCIFTILPCTVDVKIPNIKLYLGQKYKDPDIFISGSIAHGDELGISYVVDDDVISVVSSNPNYKLSVKDGRIIRSYLPSPRVRIIIFMITLFIVIILLLIIIIRRKRHRLLIALAQIKRDRQESCITDPARTGSEELEIKESRGASTEEVHLESFSQPMNAERADALISNALARELVGNEEERVFTSGRKRNVINIDTLSENFSSGERVDVNILKSKSLVPYDTAYIKVLARGVIDKPLYVYANDFSTTAIKMLALTGGKAIKVTTVKVKENGEQIEQ